MSSTIALTPNQQLLVDALRSGQYRQGQQRLTLITDDLDCCLGVGCKVAVKHGVPVEVTTGPDFGANGDVVFYDGVTMFLPESVQKFFDFRTESGGYVDEGGTTRSLAKDNDVRKHTFEQIADTIEKYPHSLFGSAL